MTKKTGLQIILCVLFIAGVLWVEKCTFFDIPFQNHFYNQETGTWWIGVKEHKILSPFFYGGFKIALGVFAGFCFVGLCLSFVKERWRKYRYPFAVILASLLFVPVIVSGAKKVTNVYTPAQLSIYGGDKPYVPVLSAYPEGYVQQSKGRGFPAGHSTGGFALMCLYFCFRSRRAKRIGLATGVALGWITGMYQTFRGEHFISHTMVSMAASWIVILLVVMCLDAVFKNDPSRERLSGQS